MTDRSLSRIESTADRPPRGAAHDPDHLGRTDPPADRSLLPSLEEGLTLLDIEGDRGSTVLQSLVLDHLLMHDGPAFWVDAAGDATTATLGRMAPSRRLLDRIHVARGFTAYQHYGAICALPAVATPSRQASVPTENEAGSSESPLAESEEEPPSLLVAPAVDAQYRAADALPHPHAETLLARTLARLADYARRYEVPVLMTRTDIDEFTAPVEASADHLLTCERTSMGPRFVGEEFETLVYPVGGGAYYQTTLAYWRQLLDARAQQVGMEPARTTQPAGRGGRVGTDMTTPAPNPLRDAWAGADGGR